MENNNTLIDGTSHCQYTDYLSLVIGSLVANKDKKLVNSTSNNTSYGPILCFYNIS